MNRFLLCLPLLASCLPPCAAQIKIVSLRLPAAPHHRAEVRAAAPHTPVSNPDVLRPAAGRPFSDVPKNHWAAAAVETLRQRGIVKGYPASK